MSNKTIAVYGRHYANGEPIRVLIAGNRIQSVDPAWPCAEVVSWPYISPALFDLQVNGYGGTWFSDENLTPESVKKTLSPFFQFGVTRLCPTLITNSFDALAAGFDAIRKACESTPWVDQMVSGCHLEGPYIAVEDGPRGAHPKQHVRPADWREFQQLQVLSGNRIRLVTLAPEVEGAIEFIKNAVKNDVVVSLGHSAATPEQVQAGVDAGATLSTHLGNGAHTMIHRHRNLIFEQLNDDRLHASLIVDGHHLPQSLVRIFVKVKSLQKIILTCDASGWAGCAPGIYENKIGRSELLPNGKLVVAGQHELLAGSAHATDTCVINMMNFAGVSLKDAVDMASRNPARLLRQEVCRLRRGSMADLMVFHVAESGLDIETTIAAGEVKYGQLVNRE